MFVWHVNWTARTRTAESHELHELSAKAGFSEEFFFATCNCFAHVEWFAKLSLAICISNEYLFLRFCFHTALASRDCRSTRNEFSFPQKSEQRTATPSSIIIPPSGIGRAIAYVPGVDFHRDGPICVPLPWNWSLRSSKDSREPSNDHPHDNDSIDTRRLVTRRPSH